MLLGRSTRSLHRPASLQPGHVCNLRGRFRVDGGGYRFAVGGSSAHTDRRTGVSVTVTGALTERPAVVTAKPCASADEALGIGVRVIYPAGTTIQPRLTVAMSDQTLYGYVSAGVGRPLPTGLTVSYHSSWPTVVAVGTGGEIRTVAPGVATVTATVTYQGAKATGQFVVKVR